MAEVPLLEQVKSAIDALDSPQHCHAASAWLVDLEGKPEAWDVAQQLMMEPAATNKRFHGANMFYHKIRHDFLQLGDRASLLKQTLISHLLALAAESHPDVPVYRRVCLSLAALALQMNETGAVGDILARLNGVVAAAPRLLLELLTVLPEECYNRHIIVAPRTRHQFSDQLCRSAAEVFQFLHQLAASCASGPPSAMATDTQKQILGCLEKWIDNADIPLNAVLLPSGVFAFALDALGQKSLLEEASGVMIVVMRRYPYSPHSKDTALISSLLPRIMGVRSLWAEEVALSAGPSIDVCRSVARLFTETMESYIELYLSPNDYGQQHILSQLLDCARFSEDFDVTRIPLRAFYELARSLKEFSHEMSNEEYDRLLGPLAPYFLELLSVAVQQLRLDDSVLRGDDRLDADEEAEREEWKDTVLDISDVVGSAATVERVCGIMQEEFNKAGGGGAGSMTWSTIEACLFVIQIVGSQLPVNEASFVPQILQLCSSCPQIMALHVAVMQVSGSLAHWISFNRKFLPAIFEQLLGALAVPALSMPASVALLKLCKHCGAKEGVPAEHQLPLDKLFQTLLHLRTAGSLALEADTTLLEGLTYIISDLSPAAAAEALKSVVQPTAESLSGHLSRGSPVSAAMADVERATVLFRYTTLRRDVYADTHPVTSVFLLMWPLLIQAMQSYNTESCYEKVCRCYKYVIKSSGSYFLPHLNAMAEHIVSQFSARPIASFLYVAAVCFGEFALLVSPFAGSDSPIGISGGSPSVGHRRRGDVELSAGEVAAAQTCLSNIYVYMSKIFFEKFRTLEDFSHHADVCEEYFFLSARVVQFLPEVLLGSGPEESQRLQVVVQAALCGLGVPHRETVKGVLTLFGEIINVLFAGKRDRISEREKVVHSTASAVTSAFAGGLVKTLLGMLGDPGSSIVVEASLENIVQVMWCLTEIAPDNMKVWVAEGVGALPGRAAEDALRLQLADGLASARHHHAYADAVEAFFSASNRRTGLA